MILRERKKKSNVGRKDLTPEMQAFLEKEKIKVKKNKIKNRPIVFMTYVMVLTFISLFAYLIYFVVHDADRVIANSANRRQDNYDEYVLKGKILSRDEKVLAETKVDDNGESYRHYPYDSLFAHTVGYDTYGRAGLELDYNADMMTSHVNIYDKFRDELEGKKNPGDKILTTLDIDLTQTAADALGGASGAVVVMDSKTGDVLVMYSNPGFNPNDMDNVWSSVHSEEGSNSTVLLNRATQGLYAPGSTFKVLTAMEFIKENSDYEEYTHQCNGSDIFNSVSIRCSGSNAHGTLDLKGAMARSCNTSFADIGVNDIDVGKLHSLAEDFLFNKKLPYNGNYSKSKFLLDKDSDKSYIPQTVIGQGDTLITPLHNALIMQSISNGGVMMKPRFVTGIYSEDNIPIKKYGTKAYGKVVDQELCEKVIPLLEEVCISGTASRYMAGKSYTVAGKTGTAEYDNNGNCNSWFVGFSDVSDPDIVVSVIVEDYNINSLSGAYVASRIMDRYYETNTK